MTFDPDRPFDELPNLPPASETETKAIPRSCRAACTAPAELWNIGKLIPNQALLINSIPMLEAQARSEIEDIVTTTDRLLHFVDDATGQAGPATHRPEMSDMGAGCQWRVMGRGNWVRAVALPQRSGTARWHS